MAFDGVTPFRNIVTLVGGLPGMSQVYEGVPAVLGPRASSWVALSSQIITEKATGVLQRNLNFIVGFGYRVTGAEATAEEQIITWVDDFIIEFYQDRRLGGSVNNGELSLTLSETPQYAAFAGQEWRIYPIRVECVQRSSYNNIQGP